MSITRRSLLGGAVAAAALATPARAQIDGDTQTAINTIVWKSAPGAQWDYLWLGDSNTAAFPYTELEIRPHQIRSVLTCGLPGNGVDGVLNMVQSLDLFNKTRPKLVGIMLGTNESLIQNVSTWKTPMQFAYQYSQIVAMALAAGAAVICETCVLPEQVSGIDAYISTTQLQAYNSIVRGGPGSVHDQFYFANPTRFAICESAGSLAGSGSYSAPGSTMDGIHLTPDLQRQRRQWWINTIESYLYQAA